MPCESHSTQHILLYRFRKVNQNPENVSSESHAKCSFLKSSTLQAESPLVFPIWTWICSTILTHAEFKNRIRSHEKPENLDSTWSKHVRTAPKTLSISRQRLTDNVSLAKTDRLKCETTRRICRPSRMVVRSNHTFDPKFFRAAVRSSLDKIWQRCFEERIVQVCYRGLILQMHTLFVVGPH